MFGISCGANSLIETKQITTPCEETLLSERTPDSEMKKLWEKFTTTPERSQEKIAVHWNSCTGTPEAIFGKLTTPSEDAPEKSARRFLLENRQLFKFSDDLKDLTLLPKTEIPGGSYFVFEQTYKDINERFIPIAYGGQVVVHFNQQAEIIAINNTYVPNINANSLALQISQEEAMKFVKTTLKLDNDPFKTELAIYPYDKSAGLVWHFIIPTTSKTLEIFIDTQKLQIKLKARDINRYFIEGRGQIFIVNPIVATTLRSMRSNPYDEIPLKGLVGNGFLDGQYASSNQTPNRISSSDNSFLYKSGEEGFTETMVYYYIDYTQRYIQETLGFNNVNNRITAYNVKYTGNSTSSYDPDTKILSFSSLGKPDAEDAEIIVHEYGHAILDDLVPGFGLTGESAAINEGFSDYLAASINSNFSNGFNDECIAELEGGSDSDCMGNRSCLRKLNTTKIFPRDYVNRSHCDSEIWSGALWEIWKLVGRVDADKIIIKSHFFTNTPNPKFNLGADAIIAAATNLRDSGKINRETNIDEIKRILTRRGLCTCIDLNE